MAIVSLTEVTFGFSQPPLLEAASLRIENGDRIGLLGRNGAGKSTLMKLICGQLEPDDGQLVKAPDIKVGLLTQTIDSSSSLRAFEVVAEGLSSHGGLIAEHYRSTHHSERSGREAERIEADMNRCEAWPLIALVDRILSRIKLEPDLVFNQLSTGMQRRVLMARALVEEPQLLLLDEPTNHLDIPAIEWLENFLAAFRGTLLFVTHDRAFLQRLATRIVELDRGRLMDWTCDYPTFLNRRAAALEAERKQEELFDRRLAEEERWIRQGIKARRTRNEGRVRALHDLRKQRKERREKLGNVRLQTNEAEKSGRLVLRAEKLAARGGDLPLFDDLSFTVSRGDRIGIIGSNGCGKSTLLKVLLQQIQPSEGTIRLGTNLQIAYFDQNREQLDETRSAVDNIADGSDFITLNGRKRHVHGYLQDFLFTPDRARTLVRYLSGGERNRLLLARVLARPSNLLVLDEPTNDLDEETLELLEEWLMDYPGTILVVSHDREFLNRVVTSVLAFDPDGEVREYDGGYDDYLRQRRGQNEEPVRSEPRQSTETEKSAPSKPVQRKLTYRERRELEALPGRIDELETALSELHQQMADPEFYQQDGEAIAKASAEAAGLQQELDSAFQRWEELDS